MMACIETYNMTKIISSDRVISSTHTHIYYVYIAIIYIYIS